MPANEYTVEVWGKPVKVYADQTSKAVWRASGSYLNQSFEVKDRTASAAVAFWRRTAEYRRN